MSFPVANQNLSVDPSEALLDALRCHDFNRAEGVLKSYDNVLMSHGLTESNSENQVHPLLKSSYEYPELVNGKRVSLIQVLTYEGNAPAIDWILNKDESLMFDLSPRPNHLFPYAETGRSKADPFKIIQTLATYQKYGLNLNDTVGLDISVPVFFRVRSAEVLKWCLDQSEADLGIRSDTGVSILHMAANAYAVGFLPIIKEAFHVRGEDDAFRQLLNAKNREGDTPLSIAIRERNPEAVRFLLSEGADPSIPNNRGQTPAYMLFRSHKENQLVLQKAMIDAFLDHGFDMSKPIYLQKTVDGSPAAKRLPVFRFAVSALSSEHTTIAHRQMVKDLHALTVASGSFLWEESASHYSSLWNEILHSDASASIDRDWVNCLLELGVRPDPQKDWSEIPALALALQEEREVKELEAQARQVRNQQSPISDKEKSVLIHNAYHRPRRV